MVVTIQNAKTHFSRLLKRVESGEEIVIARGRTPVARLVPVLEPAPTGRVFGAARDMYPPAPPEVFEPLDPSELEDWE